MQEEDKVKGTQTWEYETVECEIHKAVCGLGLGKKAGAERNHRGTKEKLTDLAAVLSYSKEHSCRLKGGKMI